MLAGRKVAQLSDSTTQVTSTPAVNTVNLDSVNIKAEFIQLSTILFTFSAIECKEEEAFILYHGKIKVKAKAGISSYIYKIHLN